MTSARALFEPLNEISVERGQSAQIGGSGGEQPTGPPARRARRPHGTAAVAAAVAAAQSPSVEMAERD